MKIYAIVRTIKHFETWEQPEAAFLSRKEAEDYVFNNVEWPSFPGGMVGGPAYDIVELDVKEN